MNQNINNDISASICGAIMSQLPCVNLPEGTRQEDVRVIIRVFMRNHPEIFWFSHQYSYNESLSVLYFRYNFTRLKKEFFSKQVDNAVRFNFQPEWVSGMSDLKKVAYVYKWIANNTTYNEYSSFNQTIYSVLINRNLVCTGYAKTAQYLLGLVGIESELVFGKFLTDKTKGGRHCWNIVKINDDCYHVDFCLSDPSLKYLLSEEEVPIIYDGLLWNYFCKPTEYVLKNRSVEFLETYPSCTKSINRSIEIEVPRPQKRFVICKSESGSTSKVYLDSFDKNVVVKKVPYNENLIDNEVRMLENMIGSNSVVRFKGRIKDGILLEQVTPWNELLKSHYYKPTERYLIDILIQLTKGLIECRDNGIVYTDIHYNNVFVTKDGKYIWGDFGIAFSSRHKCQIPSWLIAEDGKPMGSRWFMSPETYHNYIFTESSAIYSLSMLAYFVMNDMRPPFLSRTTSEQNALELLQSCSKIPFPCNTDVFGQLPRLICEILNAQVCERIRTFEEFISILNTEFCEVNPTDKKSVFNGNGFYDKEEENDPSFSLFMSNDTDIFANTVGGRIDDSLFAFANEGINEGNNFDEDSDVFATTKAPFGFPSSCSLPLDINIENDTDDFASTEAPCWFTDECSRSLDTTMEKDSDSIESALIPKSENRSTSLLESYKAKSALKSEFRSSDRYEDTIAFCPTRNCSASGASRTTNAKYGINNAISFVSDLFRGIFSSKDKKPLKEDTWLQAQQNINACVYAPREVRYGKSFIIRVYMYLSQEQEVVDSKIGEIDPSAVKKEYKPLDLPVKLGDKLTVHLDLSDGVECKTSTKTVIWQNHYEDCSFMAKLVDTKQNSIDGTASILVNDIPAGEMLFTIDVVENHTRELYTRVESHRFSKIFISYAHQDEDQVRGIAEGCKMLGTDYFFDRHTLQAGDIFKDKILNFIEQADLFVLCWSRNAAESKWVQIEREYALSLIREGRASLSIYPLSLRPEAPLPLDMSDKYNFGSL